MAGHILLFSSEYRQMFAEAEARGALSFISGSQVGQPHCRLFDHTKR
jgi:hypothetical protein